MFFHLNIYIYTYIYIYTSIYLSIYIYMSVCVCVSVCVCLCVCVCEWLKNESNYFVTRKYFRLILQHPQTVTNVN